MASRLHLGKGIKHILHPLVNPVAPYVTYDSRGIIINGTRELLLVGSIHYPRSSPGMWSHLIRQARSAGLNAIDTYVFWSMHEPEEGVWEFEKDRANLIGFIQLVKQEGMHLVLRIGPYVCAEYNLGGMPAWLLEKPGIRMRRLNKPFMDSMETFVRKVVDVTRPYLYTNGGPIILLQMENEYNHWQFMNFFHGGFEYINWAAHLTSSLNVSVPWIMCEQGDTATVINTCNGFYCHDRIHTFRWAFPNQPSLFTELWTGWFQLWGEATPTRPAEDLAVAVLNWVAAGGSLVTYYMWQGGTNFDRSSGGPLLTTSYDYDAPVTEYGFPHERKFDHLKTMHGILREYKDVIMSWEKPESILEFGLNGAGGNVLAYGDVDKDDRAILFTFNRARQQVIAFKTPLSVFNVPRWSVSISVKTKGVNGKSNFTEVFNTAKVTPRLRTSNSLVVRNTVFHAFTKPISPSTIQYLAEPVGTQLLSDQTVVKTTHHGFPPQLKLTKDKTDYLWAVCDDVALPSVKGNPAMISMTFSHPPREITHVYMDDILIGILTDKDKPELKFDVAPFIAKGGNHSLSFLTVSMGLPHYTWHPESAQKGISGHVILSGADITVCKWQFIAGLKGEAVIPANVKKQTWKPLPSVVPPLSWLRLSFPLSQLNDKKITGFKSYTLKLSSLGKGIAFVNGHAIGRYWNITGGVNKKCPTAAEGVSCKYNDEFGTEACRVGCGEPSQAYYHVPADWLNDVPWGSSTAEIVLLNEMGGSSTDVADVHLIGIHEGL
ncbi:beta-galactosidase [Synchytrium microbalum]|uniref:Beta-galactosidase n=1 Tax=Synchytrium microbalum TaxID=1806994 RepID=A0A507CBU4_9FUNG|nr:beta-galactosidase [Synchytrium microbalum]TPX35035.1 beta-galactosidase [Synchytrium microbalum]